MIEYIKKQHIAIFTGQTGCGKTHLVLDLIENLLQNSFKFLLVEQYEKVPLYFFSEEKAQRVHSR